MACHSLTENRIGPRHCGVFGRRAGAVPGFDYSPAMRHARISWNEKTLDGFLTDPMKYLPGTAMVFAGVPDRKERADVIAWLKEASAGSTICPPNAKR
jgi:cytochrome c